ncbi:MAG: S24/S26 family peptidase [Ruminococcus sp.]|nr:S24/S26 family peptidase [Ruminococcus sp.]
MVKKSTFEEELKKNGKLVYTNVGDSMKPLIRQGRDLLVIEPVHGRLKKYDVPLYKRDSGQYVLHRILKVRKNDYVICGDNRWQKEYGITDRHIIGVLTAVIRDGKKNIPVTDRKYLAYVHIWCDFFPVRAFAVRVYRKLKRTFLKLKKRMLQ